MLYRLTLTKKQKKINGDKLLAPQDWGNDATISMEEDITPNEGENLWLIEILALFDSKGNNHQQQMLAELIMNELIVESIRAVQVDPEIGQKKMVILV